MTTYNNLNSVKDKHLRTMTMLAYGLYVVGLIIPISGWVPFGIAYFQRKNAVGTLYESHLSWIMRTVVLVLICGAMHLCLKYNLNSA